MWKMLIMATALALGAAPALACEGKSAQGATPGSRMQVAQAQEPARPARGPESQTSTSNAAPSATTKDTTAATDQSPTVKQMNREAASKLEKEGK